MIDSFLKGLSQAWLGPGLVTQSMIRSPQAARSKARLEMSSIVGQGRSDRQLFLREEVSPFEADDPAVLLTYTLQEV